MKKTDIIYLTCAISSMFFSILLWFTVNREYGAYVGIWVPSILGLWAVHKLAQIEKNKMNFLSEMVLEDMIGDPDNVSNYSLNQSSCNYTNNNASKLHQKNINKWKDKLRERDYIKFDDGSGYKDKKLRCMSGDIKKVIVNNGAGKVNFFTGKGKRKKYLGVLIK